MDERRGRVTVGKVDELLRILFILLVIMMLIKYYRPLSVLLSLYTRFIIGDKGIIGGSWNCGRAVWAVGGGGGMWVSWYTCSCSFLFPLYKCPSKIITPFLCSSLIIHRIYRHEQKQRGHEIVDNLLQARVAGEL